MQRSYIIVLFVLLALVSLTACSQENEVESGGKEKKELTLLFNFAANSLDPNMDSTYTAVRAGVAETLIQLNENDLTIEPWLAKSWESKDGQHWTIQLQEGITFQNGNKVDAEAAKASLERSIKDNPAVRTALKIQSIKAEGNLLYIKTENPFPEFPSELIHPNTAIIDVTETNFIHKPVGTGPFKAVSFIPKTEVKLERYDGYWNGKAKLETAVFRFNEDANARSLAFESGAADIVYRPELESLEHLKSLPWVKVDSAETFRVHQMTMNIAAGPLADIYVRKAVDALIDREAIVENVLLGLGVEAKGPFPSTLAFSPDYPEKERGLQIAKNYMEKAGYIQKNGTMQKNGKPLELKLITYNGRPELPLISQVFQSDAKKLGIQVKFQLIESPEEYMAANRDWDLAMYSNLTAPRGDAGYYLNTTYYPGGALNFGGIEDDHLTAMIDKLNQTIGQAERAEEAKKIASYIDEQAYHSFVVHPNSLVAYNSDKVVDWITSKSEYYMLTNKLDVKK